MFAIAQATEFGGKKIDLVSQPTVIGVKPMFTVAQAPEFCGKKIDSISKPAAVIGEKPMFADSLAPEFAGKKLEIELSQTTVIGDKPIFGVAKPSDVKSLFFSPAQPSDSILSQTEAQAVELKEKSDGKNVIA